MIMLNGKDNDHAHDIPLELSEYQAAKLNTHHMNFQLL